MKRLILHQVVALFVLGILGFGTLAAQAGEVIDGRIKGGEYGKVITCGFSNAVKVDGKLDELTWKGAPWHKMTSKDGTVPAANDKDASMLFATTADDKFLYIAAKITDNKVQSGENKACDVWNDDSIEVYIDGKNDKAASYAVHHAQITVGADVIGQAADVKVTGALIGGCVGVTQGPKTETIATGEKTADGWNVEVGIPLKNNGWNIQPKDGLKIGFNMHYNDDDDGGGRDHKLIWSAEEVKLGEASWQNPSRFAELQFVSAFLSVDPASKAATTWGGIKSSLR